jgi:hypothetical protein
VSRDVRLHAEPAPSFIVAVIAYLSCALLLLLRDSVIVGPFIFYDEATYFQLARTLWEQFNYAGHTQYTPLYPLMIGWRAPGYPSRWQSRLFGCL